MLQLLASRTCQGGMWPTQWGSVRPAQTPSLGSLPRADTQGLGLAGAHHALGAGACPASPDSSHFPEARLPQKNAAWACWRLGGLRAVKNVWGKLLTSSECPVNTSFHGEMLAPGRTVPHPKLCSPEAPPWPRDWPPTWAQACSGNQDQKEPSLWPQASGWKHCSALQS